MLLCKMLHEAFLILLIAVSLLMLMNAALELSTPRKALSSINRLFFVLAQLKLLLLSAALTIKRNLSE